MEARAGGGEDEEDDGPRQQNEIFQCAFGCGFEGAFATVSQHEIRRCTLNPKARGHRTNAGGGGVAEKEKKRTGEGEKGADTNTAAVAVIGEGASAGDPAEAQTPASTSGSEFGLFAQDDPQDEAGAVPAGDTTKLDEELPAEQKLAAREKLASEGHEAQ